MSRLGTRDPELEIVDLADDRLAGSSAMPDRDLEPAAAHLCRIRVGEVGDLGAVDPGSDLAADDDEAQDVRLPEALDRRAPALRWKSGATAGRGALEPEPVPDWKHLELIPGALARANGDRQVSA